MINTGVVLALSAALLWGVSSSFAQFLFQQKGITPEWLVCTRLWLAGFFLLLISYIKKKDILFQPLSNKKDFFQLISFCLFGLFATQYTYFLTVKYSNAATATVLHYLGPVFVSGYYSFIERRFPSPKELLAIALAFIGTFLMVTHGDFSSLSISSQALFWGLLSAITLGTYSILPINLLKKYGATITVGWGMLLSGIITTPFFRPWPVIGIWDGETFFYVVFVIAIGGAGAFMAYLAAVKLIGATKASLLACTEPLAATVMAVVWLKVEFTVYDWVSMFIILSAIYLVLRKPKISQIS